MSYITDLLEEDEHILYEAKHHCFAWLSGLMNGEDYVGSRYFITNLRIIFKTGILFKDIESISISKIERVVPSQKWYQRMFDTGRIEIYGIGNAYYRLNKLSDVMLFYRRFEGAQHAIT